MGTNLSSEQKHKLISNELQKFLKLNSNKSQIEDFKTLQQNIEENKNNKNKNHRLLPQNLNSIMHSNQFYNFSLELLTKLNDDGNSRKKEYLNIFNSSIDNSRIFDYELNMAIGVDLREQKLIPFLNGNFCTINQIPIDFLMSESRENRIIREVRIRDNSKDNKDNNKEIKEESNKEVNLKETNKEEIENKNKQDVQRTNENLIDIHQFLNTEVGNEVEGNQSKVSKLSPSSGSKQSQTPTQSKPYSKKITKALIKIPITQLPIHDIKPKIEKKDAYKELLISKKKLEILKDMGKKNDYLDNKNEKNKLGNKVNNVRYKSNDGDNNTERNHKYDKCKKHY